MPPERILEAAGDDRDGHDRFYALLVRGSHKAPAHQMQLTKAYKTCRKSIDSGRPSRPSAAIPLGFAMMCPVT